MKKILLVNDKEIYEKVSSMNIEENFSLITKTEIKNQKELIFFLKKEKLDSAIFLGKNWRVDHVYKHQGSWKFSDPTMFSAYFCKQIGIVPEGSKKLLQKINGTEASTHAQIIKDRILFSEEIIDKHGEEMVKFYTSQDWENKIRDFSSEHGNLRVSKTKVKSDFSFDTENFKSFKNDIINKKEMSGFKYKNSREEKEKLIFSGMKHESVFEKVGSETYLTNVSWSEDEISLFYFHKGLIRNIKNNLYKNYNEVKKLSNKDIALSIIGFVIFIILTYFTFTTILDTNNVKKSFDIIFDKQTYTRPWIYLIWMNFILTFFFSFLVMYFVNLIVFNKKPNTRRIWVYFIAAQLRATTRFITGEAIIGTIIWGWYINKKTNIRTSSLVGTVASLGALRGLIHFFVGIPFMLIGQFYLLEIVRNVNSIWDINTMETNAFITLSWGGYIWSLAHNFFLMSIALFYPFHYLYNKIYTSITLRKNKSNVISMMQAREMSLLSMKLSLNKFSSIFKRKDRLYRILIANFAHIMLEALEIMFIFNMVEESFAFIGLIDITNQNSYNNFLQLSGIRMMVSSIKDFPIINVSPGDGIGFVEYFMSNTNQIIFINEHIDMVDNISDVSSAFSQQTTFITRFFNSYLKRILSMLITLIIVFNILKNKIKTLKK